MIEHNSSEFEGAAGIVEVDMGVCEVGKPEKDLTTR